MWLQPSIQLLRTRTACGQMLRIWSLNELKLLIQITVMMLVNHKSQKLLSNSKFGHEFICNQLSSSNKYHINQVFQMCILKLHHRHSKKIIFINISNFRPSIPPGESKKTNIKFLNQSRFSGQWAKNSISIFWSPCPWICSSLNPLFHPF